MGVMSENIHQRSMSITQHLHSWLLIDQHVNLSLIFSCTSGLYLEFFFAHISFLNFGVEKQSNHSYCFTDIFVCVCVRVFV